MTTMSDLTGPGVQQMTEPALETIEAALEAATPGPWVSTSDVTMNDRNHWVFRKEGPPFFPAHLMAVMRSADAHLIANSPSWLAALVQRVKVAEASIERIRGLHQPAPVYLFDDECDCPDSDLHNVMEVSIGEVVCLDSPTGEWYCDGCSDDTADERVPYPCPTILALDGPK